MKKINVKSGKLAPTRRAFIEKSSAAVVFSMFGLSFFTSCTDEEDTDPNNPGGNDTGISISGNTVQIELSKQEALNEAGAWLLIVEAQTLVVNVGGNFNALTSVCTHSQCDRNWTYGSETLTCTCHNSQFDPQGNVLQGPATQALTRYTVAVNNGIITITK